MTHSEWAKFRNILKSSRFFRSPAQTPPVMVGADCFQQRKAVVCGEEVQVTRAAIGGVVDAGALSRPKLQAVDAVSHAF